MSTVEQQEHKIEDLHKKVEEAKKSTENNMGINKKQEKRRTASLASLDRNHDSKYV